jgi:hypothetical protein
MLAGGGPALREVGLCARDCNAPTPPHSSGVHLGFAAPPPALQRLAQAAKAEPPSGQAAHVAHAPGASKTGESAPGHVERAAPAPGAEKGARPKPGTKRTSQAVGRWGGFDRPHGQNNSDTTWLGTYASVEAHLARTRSWVKLATKLRRWMRAQGVAAAAGKLHPVRAQMLGAFAIPLPLNMDIPRSVW